MNIQLYYAPITCALAPYITLTEAGADFQVHPLNMRKDEHKSLKYLQINPKHKVPLLVVDGQVLSESTAWRVLVPLYTHIVAAICQFLYENLSANRHNRLPPGLSLRKTRPKCQII